MRRPNATSFRKGMTRSPESIEKQRATLRRLHAEGALKMPFADAKVPSDIIARRAASRRRNSIGNRRKSGDYWMVMTEDGPKYEHRLIMEKKVGRKLLSTELVHHDDRNKSNNDPENLFIRSLAAHSKEHEPESREKRLRAAANISKLEDSKWSRKFECCLVCRSTERRHIAKGLCSTCYRNQYGSY